MYMFNINEIKKIITSMDTNLYKYKEIALKKKNQIYGNEVFLRGIIEFSNHCRKDCLYCGIRKSNKIVRYRMNKEDIKKSAQKIYKRGIKTIVLQSGEDLYYSREAIVEIISEIKKDMDCAITLCIGERSYDDYKAFFDAGADRYLIKHETSNDRAYKALHPDDSLKNRLKNYEILKKIGYKVGLGNIIGLPYTSLEDYIGDIFLMKELDCDMAAIGPFLPAKGTPFSNYAAANTELVIKILTFARIILEDLNIPATTALYTLGGEKSLSEALECGCNVIMPNFTPKRLRKNYRIYDGKTPLSIEKIKKILYEKGLKISPSKGERRSINVH